MPIPAFTDDGLLPPGSHECTLEEVVERFGSFQSSDRRPTLSRDLKAYVGELLNAGIAKYLIVNGSYVTTTDTPNDIDLLLVLKDDLQLHNPVPPFQYNPRSKRYVRNKFRLDFYFGFEGDPSAQEIMSIFQQVKYQPGKEKGVLKVTL
jgi:hypothetical protein